MNNILADAVFGKKIPHFPIWMMRQAGRYLPEYQDIKQNRAGGNFWEMVHKPELACEVTLQPWKRFGVDALILFSDILTPLPPMGFDINFVPHPVFKSNANQIGIENLVVPTNLNTKLSFVTQAIQKIKKSSSAPLIGFGGAPYTLACYSLKDSLDKDFCSPRMLYYKDRDKFELLLNKLSAVVADYLNLQIEAGVDAIMLFDTWAGSLSLEQYQVMALPFLESLLKKLNTKPNLPKMYYTSNTLNLAPKISKLDIDVVVCDWRSSLEKIRKKLPEKFAISGNLDPALLFGPQKTIKIEVLKILELMSKNQKFVFNLGHGVYQKTPLENVEFLVKLVQNFKLQ